MKTIKYKSDQYGVHASEINKVKTMGLAVKRRSLTR